MFRYVLVYLLAPALAAVSCSVAKPPTPFISAEPEVESVQTRLPRTLRLYFEQLPDVPRSSVTLTGPNGELNLRGLHSMGANDLMMEIYDEVVDGQYTVEWQTYVGEDPNQYSGSYSFTVRAE